MTSRAVRSILWALLCVLSASCGGGGAPVVAVIATQVPAGTVALHVSAALNAAPGSSIAPITDLTHPFALELPVGSSGVLAVAIDAWNGGTAIVARGAGSIAVPASGQVVLDIPLTAQSPALAVTLASVAPARGATKGGARLTLTGQLFKAGATVAFQVVQQGRVMQQALGTGVQVVSATQITVTTPAWTGPPGKVTLQVQNPDGQSGSRSNAYDYVPYQLGYNAVNYKVGGGSLHAAVADIDGNGTADLAVSSATLGQVQILLNDGHGAFGPVVGVPIAVCAGLSPVPAIDVFAGQLIKGVKRSDLVVRCGTQQFETVLGPLLTRTSTPAVVFPKTAPLQWLVVSDLNTDGAVDVAVTSQSASGAGSGVLMNNGSGVFPTGAMTAPVFSEAFPGNLGAIATGPVFKAGEGDLLIQSFDNHTLDLHQDESSKTAASFPITKQIVYANTSAARALLLADLDGNGAMDGLVVGFTSGGTTLVPSALLGLSGTAKTVDALFRPPLLATDMALGDLDGDGFPDLLAGRGDDRSVLIYTGNGDGTFSTAPVVIPTPGQAQGVVIADLNGDGYPDLVITSTDPTQSQVSVLLNKGP